MNYPLLSGTKAIDTKKFILQQALHLAEKNGLEGLTLGQLSKVVDMSKSGLYAHFKSKEDLQIEILNEASQQFTEYVILPATKVERGICRIRTLNDLWMKIIKSENSASGCLIITSVPEFDSRPGIVKNMLKQILHDFKKSLERSVQVAIKENNLKQDMDINQFVFEWNSLILGYYQYLKIHRTTELDKMVQNSFESLIKRNSR